MSAPAVLTIPEVADRLKLSQPTVRTLIDEDLIPTVEVALEVGREQRVSEAWVEEWEDREQITELIEGMDAVRARVMAVEDLVLRLFEERGVDSAELAEIRAGIEKRRRY